MLLVVLRPLILPDQTTSCELHKHTKYIRDRVGERRRETLSARPVDGNCRPLENWSIFLTESKFVAATSAHTSSITIHIVNLQSASDCAAGALLRRCEIRGARLELILNKLHTRSCTDNTSFTQLSTARTLKTVSPAHRSSPIRLASLRRLHDITLLHSCFFPLLQLKSSFHHATDQPSR